MPQSADSYREPRLSEAEMKKARERAKHVIVLMLENRSFDHMLGFLDHPFPDRFKGLRHSPPQPIPVDLNDRSADPIGPIDTGTPRLGVDPPHGHVSALEQLNLLGNEFKMNGFPTAYGRKLNGKEAITVPRWGRIVLISPFLAIIVGAAIYDLARLGILGGWAGFVRVHLLALLLAVLFLVGRAQLTAAPGVTRVQKVLALTALPFFLALAVQAIWRWVGGEPGWVGWPIVTWMVLLYLIWITRKSMKQRARVPPGRVREESKNIMRCMAPDRVPVLAKLARDYAVCTQWYSSVPGATWPNRNFAHAGTSDESVDIEIGFYDDPTIFDRLDEANATIDGPELDPTWRIYHERVPQIIAFRNLWTGWRNKNWVPLGQLVADIGNWRPDNVTLPMYSFVEPCHQGPAANSQHPGNNEEYGSQDFERGEGLIASIYDALVGNADLFERTVLLITYDEHGGFYDHCPPPKAVPPEPLQGRSRSWTRNFVGLFVDYNTRSFSFAYLGVRVPAVVVSPWVEPGTVSETVYDHSSIAATVRRLFAPTTERLTVREDHANDFLALIVKRTSMNNPTPTEPGMVTATARREVGDTPKRVSTAVARGNDPFEEQLATIEELVHERLASVIQPAAAREAGDEIERTPTMALFRAAAERTRDGDPLPPDF